MTPSILRMALVIRPPYSLVGLHIPSLLTPHYQETHNMTLFHPSPKIAWTPSILHDDFDYTNSFDNGHPGRLSGDWLNHYGVLPNSALPDQTRNYLAKSTMNLKEDHATDSSMNAFSSLNLNSDIEASPSQTYGAYANHADRFFYSDSESDSSSDSSSEFSFYVGDEPVQYSLYTGPGDTINERLPPLGSLLLKDERRSAIVPKQADVLLRHVPADLRDIIHDININYDPFSQTLNIVLGQVPVQNDTNDGRDCSSYSQSNVSSLSVTISEFIDTDITLKKQCQFLIWVLSWAHIHHGNTIEDLNISVPGSFLPVETSSLDYVDSFFGMRSFGWSGDSRALIGLLPRLMSPNTNVVKLKSELGISDALVIMNELSKYNVVDLELGNISSGAPHILGFGANQILQQIVLPNMDSLNITASVPLDSFFDSLLLHFLCKVQFDVSSAKELQADVLGSLVNSELLGPNIFFVEIGVRGAFEGMEDMMGLIMAKAPLAYTAFSELV